MYEIENWKKNQQFLVCDTIKDKSANNQTEYIRAQPGITAHAGTVEKLQSITMNGDALTKQTQKIEIEKEIEGWEPWASINRTHSLLYTCTTQLNR